jgi:hypothetical protein
MFLAKAQRTQRKYGFKKLIAFVVLGVLGAFARVNSYILSPGHKSSIRMIADDRKRDREVDSRYRGTNSS